MALTDLQRKKLIDDINRLNINVFKFRKLIKYNVTT